MKAFVVFVLLVACQRESSKPAGTYAVDVGPYTVQIPSAFHMAKADPVITELFEKELAYTDSSSWLLIDTFDASDTSHGPCADTSARQGLIVGDAGCRYEKRGGVVYGRLHAPIGVLVFCLPRSGPVTKALDSTCLLIAESATASR